MFCLVHLSNLKNKFCISLPNVEITVEHLQQEREISLNKNPTCEPTLSSVRAV